MGAVGTPIAVKDAATLSAELTRVADICHGCRRCFSLCPSFDVLFKGLDVAEVDGEAEKLPKKVLDDFVDLCYECKLCLPHCPYIPPHRWAVDVPHLVLESRNVRMKETGLPLRERLLSRPDALGRLARPVAPVANFVNTLPLARWALEKTLGVSARERSAAFRVADVHGVVRDPRGARQDGGARRESRPLSDLLRRVEPAGHRAGRGRGAREEPGRGGGRVPAVLRDAALRRGGRRGRGRGAPHVRGLDEGLGRPRLHDRDARPFVLPHDQEGVSVAREATRGGARPRRPRRTRRPSRRTRATSSNSSPS